MAAIDNNDTEVCLAYCNRTDLSSWPHHAKVIMKNNKIGIVVDENNQRDIIVPIDFDTWFTYEGDETKIEADFFDEWWKCLGYFANKNDDGTYTCYEYDKEGHLIWLFTCESFDADTITINGKKYIGRSDEQEGFDDVVRLGYEALSGTDNCYFALRQGKKWSLKSDDLKDTYLDYTECDEICSIERTPVGMNVVVRKGNKRQLFIHRYNGTIITLFDSFDDIQVAADLFVDENDEIDYRGSFIILYQGKKLAICSDDLQYRSPFIFDHFGDILNRNEIMVERLGKKMPYHIINAEGFGIKTFRSFNEDEKAFAISNEIVASKAGKAVRFRLRSGEDKYIPLSEYSLLNIGDSLDLRTAVLLTLCREGYSDRFQVVETLPIFR